MRHRCQQQAHLCPSVVLFSPPSVGELPTWWLFRATKGFPRDDKSSLPCPQVLPQQRAKENRPSSRMNHGVSNETPEGAVSIPKGIWTAQLLPLAHLPKDTALGRFLSPPASLCTQAQNLSAYKSPNSLFMPLAVCRHFSLNSKRQELIPAFQTQSL